MAIQIFHRNDLDFGGRYDGKSEFRLTRSSKNSDSDSDGKICI